MRTSSVPTSRLRRRTGSVWLTCAQRTARGSAGVNPPHCVLVAHQLLRGVGQVAGATAAEAAAGGLHEAYARAGLHLLDALPGGAAQPVAPGLAMDATFEGLSAAGHLVR
jgi:hypothetical protein